MRNGVLVTREQQRVLQINENLQTTISNADQENPECRH
jgi:hypothetical protein